MISEVPPLICNPEFTEQIVGFMKELDIPKLTPYPGISASASEDFANIAEQVPSAFMYLSAGYMDDEIHPNAFATELIRMIAAKIGQRYLIIKLKIFFLRKVLSP